MVIGRGLLAKAFSEFIHNDKICIFASGVSNSKETDKNEFEREINLISNFFNFKGLFVYFSTCSISDQLLKDSAYIKHKLSIEEIIKNKFTNYFIIRLPNVVGNSSNPYTMFNFFKNCIQNDIPFEVQKNAYRYFINIEDVYTNINRALHKNNKFNCTVNLVPEKSMSVLSFVKNIESELGKKGKYICIEGGSKYHIKKSVIFN